jgi:hypothetical protein
MWGKGGKGLKKTMTVLRTLRRTLRRTPGPKSWTLSSGTRIGGSEIHNRDVIKF